jgi:hypothetical protein
MEANHVQLFPPLEQETRTNIETAAAAHYLLRRPQTLRLWASQENGPLRPVRVYGRLAWPVAEIRRILAGNAQAA